MDKNKIKVSVVIPTHNRKDSLKRTLDTLAVQIFPVHNIEVIVVADGCTDGTHEMLEGYDAPFRLKVVYQPGNGPASARNRGAKTSSGWLLVFLDDDIEASPKLIDSHFNKHLQAPDQVVIGYLPPVLENQKGIFRTKLREWWENMFLLMGQQGHRFNFRNLLSGNFSITTKLFNQVGGFNVNFKCQEDYELGLRLIYAGANLVYSSDALGYHHELTDLKRSLQRKYHEGKAAVQFALTYPEIRYVLPLFNLIQNGSSSNYRKLLVFIFNWPFVSNSLANIGLRFMDVFEWLHLRGSWQKTLNRLLAYWYLRGLADAVEDINKLTDLLNSCTGESTGGIEEYSELTCTIDLMEGIEVAEQKLDEHRPNSLYITYGQQRVGYIAPKCGFENLKGKHLRAILANELAVPLLQAMSMAKGNDDINFPDLLTNFKKEISYA